MQTLNLDILTHFNILYIESDNTTAKQTSEILNDFVKTLHTCATLSQAREIISSTKIDAIVSDIALEGDETSLNLLAQLRANGSNIPFIFATDKTETKYLLEAIKLKADGYILKPINVRELLNSLYTSLLPFMNLKAKINNEIIMKTVAAVTNNKDVEIIKFLINNIDKNGYFNYTQNLILEHIDVSKPTLIKLFKRLGELRILTKEQNSKYKFHPEKLQDIEI